MNSIMTLLKPINNPNLLIPCQQYYIQTLYREDKLIPEQYPGEKKTHYFKWPLTHSPTYHMNRTVVLQPAKRTPPNTSRNKSSTIQRTEVCTISNSHNKLHQLGTKYQITSEKYHTKTNTMVTKHNR